MNTCTLGSSIRTMALLLFASSALTSLLHAQSDTYDQDWRWVQFTTEAGLPSDHIFNIAETNDGTVWVATAGGIAWYDGYRWIPIDSALAPISGRPDAFYVDFDNQILVAFDGRCYIGGKSGFKLLCDLYARSALPFARDSVLLTVNNSLYVYSRGKALLFNAKATPPLGEVLEIWRTVGGGIWVNTWDGLYRWEGDRWKLKLKSEVHQLRVARHVLLENDRGVGIASIGVPFSMWGIWDLNRNANPPFSLKKKSISIKTATMGHDDRILAVDESGLAHMRQKGKWSRINFQQPQIRDIELVQYRSNGDLWIGTQRGLFLYKHSSTRWTYVRHESPDPRNSVNEVVKTKDGALWFGTSNGIEIHKANGSVKSIDHINGKPLYVVTGLIEDRDGNVWVSSGAAFDGAYRWDGKGWTYVRSGTPLQGNCIHKIRIDKSGRLWFLSIWPFPNTVDSDAPLGAYVYENGKFTEHWGMDEGLPDKQVYAYAQGQDGAMWFGTRVGLSRWKAGQWTHWRQGEEHPMWPVSRVFAIAVDSAGTVWFGDRSHGLGYIDRHDSLHCLTVTDGLANNEVWDIQVAKKGNMWISTSGGISNFDKGIWTSIDSRSGLLSSDLWPILPIDNKLYVGSRGSGLSILDLSPGELHAPIVMIERAAVLGNSAVLQWKTLAFWGDPSPANIATRYRVDDGKWSRWSTTHTANVNGLSSGDHTVQVQALGLFGNFDPAGNRSLFHIEMPVYKHPLVVFPTVGVVILVMVFGATLFFRKKEHHAQLRESEAKFRAITATTSSAIFIHSGLKMLFVNPSAEVLTGYTEEELLRSSMLDIVHRDSREEFVRMSQRTKNNQDGMQRSEFMIVKKNGESRWIDYSEGRIDFYGVASMVGTCFDITNRKNAEKKNLANQEQLRSLATELSSTEERERRRMATFLHDSIGQALAICKIKLGVLQRSASAAGLSEQLDEIRSFLDLSIQNTRSLTFELSPPILHELGLVPAIEWLAEQMQRQHKINFSFEDDGEEKPLSDELRTLLFHAVRELLVNVIKHAQARNVVIATKRQEHVILLVVSDDGIGQDLTKISAHFSRSGGFGLFNIRERLKHLGGRMEIDSSPGFGTRVVLVSPLHLSEENNIESMHEQTNSPS